MDGVIAYSDGACSGNPGPGGWAALLVLPGGMVRELGGGAPRTTNNIMELTGAIEVLTVTAELRVALELRVDSEYVMKGASLWLPDWKRRGWKTAARQPVKNQELWERLDALVARQVAIRWTYVRGHSGEPGNDRCDAIAVSYAQGTPLPLYAGPRAAYPVPLG